MNFAGRAHRRTDVAIIGAGILGASVAYLIASFSKLKVTLVESEMHAGAHSSSRNTGVIHRPFYLNPSKKAVFSRAANESFPLWKEMSAVHGLPWNRVGTLEAALDGEGLKSIENYGRFALANGMDKNEFQILDKSEMAAVEPSVACEGAFFSMNDTCVSFGEYTRKLLDLSSRDSMDIMFGQTVIEIDPQDGILIIRDHAGKTGLLEARCVLNVSGGEALRLARISGVAREFSVLHFRGDYWKVGQGLSKPPSHNIYSVPKHSEYPFLDPHYVIRHDGSAEVGPTASVVSGPYKYPMGDGDLRKGPVDLFSRPYMPKVRLFCNREFLSLIREEWRSSVSRSQMARRVQKFLPGMDRRYLTTRGLSGIRHSLVDRSGFVPEAITVTEGRSFHVLNYNSPGATGAPAYAAYVIGKLGFSGLIDSKKMNLTGEKEKLWGRSVDNLFSVMGF
ncbi:MAG: FAD-dependent oxidoreductase [Candidatus Thermoplasmatota archaeon]|jgi:L-2-hydroxyglutarate oxidase|nr:FAD-dependent oxidoreductase [Candidatus Thermoplasmatota archaeon]MCL5793493.1 FAD-dependent oxidoreductase [Candidatus Thermoplasmatota archaeon]